MLRQRLLALALGTAAGGLLLPTPPAVAHDGGRKLTTELTGAAEVPKVGDPDGRGTAALRVNVGQSRVCYQLSVRGIASATAAHIHEAPAGVAGPVVVPLAPPRNGGSSGCVTVSRELARDIVRHPADYYVNVHNQDFPGGALRGQLSH